LDENCEKFTLPSSDVEMRIELRKSTARPVTGARWDGNVARSLLDYWFRRRNTTQRSLEAALGGMPHGEDRVPEG
jgi:hypothetical protein